MSGLVRQRSTVYFVAAIISLALSYWACVKEVVINPDAICYLQSAETMKMGLMTAMHLCDQAKWPLYSALVYIVMGVTKLSSVYAAYLLNSIFSLISVVTFIGIFQFFKVPIRLLWFAALVILLAPEFNSVRVYIVRDHGFWAFYLVSIFFLLNYFQKPRWHVAIAWNLSIIVATLFRIEGLLFFLFMPFIAWFDCSKKLITRFKAFLQLNTVILVGLIGLAVCFWFYSKQITDGLGRVDEVEFQILHGFEMMTSHFHSNAAALGQYVLSQYAAGDAAWILFLMLCVWYVALAASNVSVVYAVLVVYAWCKKLLSVDSSSKLVLWSYVFFNVFITAIFLVENMFLSKRYLLALSLVLMIWVPFAINDFAEGWRKHKLPFILVMIFVFGAALGGIFNFGHSKAYIQEAGTWLAEHTPENAAIYSNDYQVMFYSHHFANAIFDKAPIYAGMNVFTDSKWKQFDYLAIRTNKSELEKNATNMKQVGLTPVQVFSNKRGDQVSIYKIR